MEEKWPISELNVLVVKINTLNKSKTLTGSATGFFFNDNGMSFLITNKHVVSDSYYFQIYLHNSYSNYSLKNEIIINLYKDDKPNWLDHPDYPNNRADIVAIPMNNAVLGERYLWAYERSIINYLSEKNFLGDVKMSTFAEVIIVGYPLGFYDVENNLPVYRKGAIASTYSINFNQEPCFLIDANLHPGTSGSPVLCSPNNILISPKGAFHSDAFIFLGIHSAEYNIGKEPLGLCKVWYANLILEIIRNKT